jgi:hypothetical protein
VVGMFLRSRTYKKIVVSVCFIFIASLILPGLASGEPTDNEFGQARGKPTGGNNGKPTKPTDPGTGGTTSPGGKYALVIGIANYYGSSYDLEYCDDDARDWANYLSGKGYTVHTLIDSQATAANIDSEINWLNSMENAGDSVVFIYSGHGVYSGGSSNILSYELAYISDSYMANKFATFSSTKMFFEFDACQIGGMKARWRNWKICSPDFEHKNLQLRWHIKYGKRRLYLLLSVCTSEFRIHISRRCVCVCKTEKRIFVSYDMHILRWIFRKPSILNFNYKFLEFVKKVMVCKIGV